MTASTPSQGADQRYIPLTGAVFHHLVAALGEQGLEDLDWAESVQPPRSAEAFAREAIFVIPVWRA